MSKELYKAFIDGLVERKDSMASRWIKGDGFPQTDDNKAKNVFLAALTPEQREYMYHRIREIRGFEGGKPIFVFDFQNDGEFVGGCIAGGRFYCHINPNGDVEPCVFIHYSNANIHDKPLLECLSQPLFRAYQMGQPFNENDLRPCPMLENPEALQKIVHATDAKSTDMQSPETVESLCGKCEAYAKCWAPEAEKLKEANPKQITREKGTLPEV